MSASEDMRKRYTEYVEEIRCKFDSAVESVINVELSSLSALRDTRIIVDKSSKDVFWSKPPGKPLRVSLHRLRDSCCYLDMSGGARTLYHHANEPESVMLSRCLKEFVEHPENYPCGIVKHSPQAAEILHVDCLTGDILPTQTSDEGQNFDAVTRDSSNEIIFRIVGFSYTITCSSENSTVLWELRFASLKILDNDRSSNGARCHEEFDAKPIRGTVGNISFSDNVIGKSGEDTVLVEGEYRQGQEGDVFHAMVKRIKMGYNDDAVWNEIRNLRRFAGKPNVIGFYGWEADEHFFYLAFEHCWNLRDFVHQYCYDPKQQLKLISEIVDGLVSHDTRIILGNTDISDVFVNEHSNLKISVISEKTKLPLISFVNKYPYFTIINGKIVYPSISSFNSAIGYYSDTDDMLALGRLIFFILAGFEYKNGYLTKSYLLNYCTNLIYDNPEALDLLRKLLDDGPARIQTALQVWNHPLFWDPSKKLNFILTVDEHLESEASNSELLRAMNTNGEFSFRRLDFHLRCAVESVANIRVREYNAMHYLIRFIRNLTIHKSKITDEIFRENIVKYVPSEVLKMITTGEFGSYFFSRFPNLVMEVYKIMKEKCGEDIKYREYFKDRLDN